MRHKTTNVGEKDWKIAKQCRTGFTRLRIDRILDTTKLAGRVKQQRQQQQKQMQGNFNMAKRILTNGNYTTEKKNRNNKTNSTKFPCIASPLKQCQTLYATYLQILKYIPSWLVVRLTIGSFTYGGLTKSDLRWSREHSICNQRSAFGMSQPQTILLKPLTIINSISET